MLAFYYGLMNSGKSSLLIGKYYAIKDQTDERVIVLKSSRDRLGTCASISSRAPLKLETDIIIYETTRLDLLEGRIFFIDEVQFLQPEQIVQLRRLADAGSIVYCFGLLTDYRLKPFPASQQLISLADELHRVELTKPMCKKCKMRMAIGHQPDSFEWCCFSCHAHASYFEKNINDV